MSSSVLIPRNGRAVAFLRAVGATSAQTNPLGKPIADAILTLLEAGV
jgi:hypothetical protein